MKIAYLIDRESLGGGCEYIRRQIAAHPADACRVFLSEKGECTAAVLDGWGADAIVVNHLKALLQLLGRPWARPRGTVRMVVHGIHLRKYPWRLREGRGIQVRVRLAYLLRRLLESWLYRRCDEIVALTETDRAEILRLYGRNLRVVVEPHASDGLTPRLSGTLPPGLDGSFAFVCIGRFDYPKGQDRWIRLMAKSDLAAGRTLFVGDGPTLGDCRELAARLGVASRCVFAGAIPEAERYLKCAGAVVSPSRWEGMPYVMMKARAAGCRILATDCPGNRDVLAGYDGWERLDA